MPQYTQAEMYQKLKDYLPFIYDSIVDTNELLETESFELSDLWGDVQNVFLETFTDTMTLEGIERWEDILNLAFSSGDTLEDRKKAIQIKLFVKNKANFTFLRSALEPYGTVEELTFDDAISTVIIDLFTQSVATPLFTQIRDIIPAHLILDFIFTVSKETIGIQEQIYGQSFNRVMKIGSNWKIGITQFGEDIGSEVQYK
jgi:hypothetical protein